MHTTVVLRDTNTNKFTAYTDEDEGVEIYIKNWGVTVGDDNNDTLITYPWHRVWEVAQ